MKITNQPPGSPIRPESGESKKPSAADKGFALNAEKASASVLEGIRSRYKAADLDDPAKGEAAVRESLRALVSSQAVGGRLGAEQQAKLVDFLQSDPIVRGKIDALLRKALA